MNSVKSNSIEEAVRSESPAIAVISAFDKAKTGTNDAVIGILTLLIEEVIAFLNVGKSMTVQQMKMTIDLIVADHLCANLKPEDFKVCFDKIKKGGYGSLYDRFDGQILIECLHKYCNERADVCESINLTKHTETKNLGVHHKFVKTLVETKKEIEEQEKANKAQKKEREKDNSEKAKFIQSCFRKFEEIYKLQPVVSETGEYILLNGKTVNQIEYTKIRLAEEYSKSKQEDETDANDNRA